GLPAAVDLPRRAAVAGLLHDGDLRLPQVVRDQRVRPRRIDRGRDGAVHVRRDACLSPADAEGGRGLLSFRRPRFSKLGWNLLALTVLFVMVFPIYWMVATAFK